MIACNHTFRRGSKAGAMEAWGRMTKLERVMAVLEGRKPDRLPVYDKLRNSAAIEMASGLSLEKQPRDAVTSATGKLIDITVAVRFPRVPYETTDADGFRWRYEKWTEWVAGRPFGHVDEFCDYMRKDIRRNHECTFTADYRRVVHQRLLELTRDTGGTVICEESEPGLNTALVLAGVDYIAYAAVDAPGLLSEWLESLLAKELKRVDCIADPGVIPVVQLYTDIAGNKTLLFSPSFLEREFFPRLTRLVQAWKAHGAKCLFHSDGDLMPVIDTLVACEVDGFHPIDTKAGMDLAKLVERIGDRVTLIGAVDCTELLPFGSPEDVRRCVRNNIEITRGLRYMVGSTSELHEGIPADNIVAMVEEAHNSLN